MGSIAGRDLDAKEIPGGLFTATHWTLIAADLLDVVRAGEPEWDKHLKPQTRQWAIEYLEFVEKEKRMAKQRALAKLTYDDKVALGLPTT